MCLLFSRKIGVFPYTNDISILLSTTCTGIYIFMSSLCGVRIRVCVNVSSKTIRPRDMLFFLKDTLSIEDENLFRACKFANLISKLNFYKLIPHPMDNCFTGRCDRSRQTPEKDFLYILPAGPVTECAFARWRIVLHFLFTS